MSITSALRRNKMTAEQANVLATHIASNIGFVVIAERTHTCKPGIGIDNLWGVRGVEAGDGKVWKVVGKATVRDWVRQGEMLGKVAAEIDGKGVDKSIKPLVDERFEGAVFWKVRLVELVDTAKPVEQVKPVAPVTPVGNGGVAGHRCDAPTCLYCAMAVNR